MRDTTFFCNRLPKELLLLMDSNKQGLANTEQHSAAFVVSFLVALMIDQVKSLRSK